MIAISVENSHHVEDAPSTADTEVNNLTYEVQHTALEVVPGMG